MERSKQYYQDNKDSIAEKSRQKNANPEYKQMRKEYRATRKERDAELYRQWRVKNQDRIKNNKKKRYSLERDIEINFTEHDWKSCKEHFGNSCSYCGNSEIEITQDHFIPISKNGSHTIDNILPVCRSCNSSKRDTNFEDWYYWQEFYSEDRENFLLNYLGYELT